MMLFKILFITYALFILDTSAQQCQGEINVDYFGNDITVIYVSSFSECCARCGSIPACQIWTFVPVSTACWLKTSVGNRRLSSFGRISGVRPASNGSTTLFPTTITTTASTTRTTSIARRTCQVENNKNYYGNDIQVVASIQSTGDCCTVCLLTRGCVSFSYFIQFGSCFLKGAFPINSSVFPYTGINSGYVV